MSEREISEKDRKRADRCRRCPVCRRARERQRGPAYRLVRTVESRLCPWCRAYERVTGRKAHEPEPPTPH